MTRTLPEPQPMREVGMIDRARFDRDIRTAGQPVVMRGLAAEWPAVQAALGGGASTASYFLDLGPTRSVSVIVAQPQERGRFFYTDDCSALNFAQRDAEMAFFFDGLINHEQHSPRPNAVAMQSEHLPSLLPQFTRDNRMPLLDLDVDPRLWIGNRIQVAPHYDLAENIGVVVSGRRRFTLFPPEQISNLYPGPLELTPAGTPVSMVELANPDLDRFPSYPEAAATAQAATLEPGDAIYIPLAWWHGVDSLEPVSAFVNYWWNQRPAGLPSPYAALMLTIASLRHLDANHRRVWELLFDHYVFDTNHDAGAHLPEGSKGLLGEHDPDQLARLLKSISQTAIG